MIRAITQADLTKINTIVNVSFPRFYRYFAWKSVSDLNQPTLVCENTGVLEGFAKLITFEIGQVRYGCILWIATHPSFRRKGVALELTNASIGHFRRFGVRAVFASTQPKNFGALKTLDAVGFRCMRFWELRRMFGWCVFSLFRDIWFAPSEVLLMLDL